MEVAPTQSVPDTHHRSLPLLALSSAVGIAVAWYGFQHAGERLPAGNAHQAAGSGFFGICTALFSVAAAWVALCGAPRAGRAGVLLLELLHVCIFHAVLAALGHAFPLAPMLGGVACAGLLPECFRRRPITTKQPFVVIAVEKLAHAEPREDASEENSAAPIPESPQGIFGQTLGKMIVPGNQTLGIDALQEDGRAPRGMLPDFAPDEADRPAKTPIETADALAAPETVSAPEKPSVPVREECSVVHCEVSNHAALVNALPPADFAELINKVLRIFESMVEARGGQCDRLSSDGMRAFFRNSVQTQAHAESAVRSALAIRARLETLSQQCELDFGHELDLRFGINSGSMLVAPFGPPSKSILSVAGEAAEWGVRLAGANLLYGSKILLGTRTSALALDCVETRPIDLLQRQLPPEPPEEVFELLALRGTLSSDAAERLTRYREGVDHFRARRWRQASAALRAARAPRQNDDAIDLLLHRISEQESLADYAVDGH